MRRRNTEVVYARQGGTRVHVVGNARRPWAGNTVGRCGAELSGDEYLARMVPEYERCQAPACRRWWPATLRLLRSAG